MPVFNSRIMTAETKSLFFHSEDEQLSDDWRKLPTIERRTRILETSFGPHQCIKISYITLIHLLLIGLLIELSKRGNSNDYTQKRSVYSKTPVSRFNSINNQPESTHRCRNRHRGQDGEAACDHVEERVHWVAYRRKQSRVGELDKPCVYHEILNLNLSVTSTGLQRNK